MSATTYNPNQTWVTLDAMRGVLARAKRELAKANEYYRTLEDDQEARPGDEAWDLTDPQQNQITRAKEMAAEIHDLATSMARKLGVPNV